MCLEQLLERGDRTGTCATVVDNIQLLGLTLGECPAHQPFPPKDLIRPQVIKTIPKVLLGLSPQLLQ